MVHWIFIAIAIALGTPGSSNAMDVATFLAHPRDSAPVEVTGYLVSTYGCPPCPPPAQCKPCVGDHVTIADTVAPGAPRVNVLCEAAALPAFQIGQRYRLEVEYRGPIQGPPFHGEPHLRAARLDSQPGPDPAPRDIAPGGTKP